MRKTLFSATLVLLCLVSFSVVLSQTPRIESIDPDFSKQPTLYVVTYAHLDTQWRWQYTQVKYAADEHRTDVLQILKEGAGLRN